jgi:antirestriction protein ArdC
MATKQKDGQAVIYNMITEKIEELLEAGTVPWHKPWISRRSVQRNGVSGKAYRGINVWLLASTKSVMGYSSDLWFSFKQVQERKGQVKKGEKGTIVVFWKPMPYTVVDEKTGDEKQKTYMLLRYYRVFNLDQTEGVKLTPKVEKLIERIDEPVEFTPIQEAEQVVMEWAEKPVTFQGADAAYYVPARDEVHMPDRQDFDSAETYYATLFHEYSHATGHKSRLDRKSVQDAAPFGSEVYSEEELVAEMASAFICGTVGISPAVIGNSAAYIKHWLGKLKDDRRMIVFAAQRAQKAADMILGVEKEEVE